MSVEVRKNNGEKKSQLLPTTKYRIWKDLIKILPKKPDTWQIQSFQSLSVTPGDTVLERCFVKKTDLNFEKFNSGV